MKGIIWGNTFESACNKLTDIITDYVRVYGEDIIDDVVRTKYNHYVTFTNGDVWRAVRAVESSRGIKCNISYIDINIPQDIVHTIIKPSTKAFPYAGYNFY